MFSWILRNERKNIFPSLYFLLGPRVNNNSDGVNSAAVMFVWWCFMLLLLLLLVWWVKLVENIFWWFGSRCLKNCCGIVGNTHAKRKVMEIKWITMTNVKRNLQATSAVGSRTRIPRTLIDQSFLWRARRPESNGPARRWIPVGSSPNPLWKKWINFIRLREQ